MSDKPGASTAGSAAAEGAAASTSNGAAASSSTAAAKRAATEGNPAFRAMGLPRLRLPSRNWMIFLSITGGFASAVIYDKWQTRRVKAKWANLVSHMAEETLSTKSMPRRLTIYLSAPPGDGLRSAREHFHNYVKPVLVAAAMDWDVVEGRKEGDVRYKTAERIRRKRKRAGEGEPLTQEEAEKLYAVEAMRERSGTTEYDGIAGDLIIGRHTWKEYVRGLHEGWLGPPDAPKQPDPEVGGDAGTLNHIPAQPSLGDTVADDAARIVEANTASDSTPPTEQDAPMHAEEKSEEEKNVEEKKEDEKPKPRNPPPYITPLDYSTATLSPSTPEIIGPSTAIRFPHILGFLNTPTRISRFLTRRRLADDVGRQVAAAVLASHHQPFTTVAVSDDESASGVENSVPEQTQVLRHEETDWMKNVRQPRKEHEESVWIEDMVLDERLASRMRRFELTSEDEERARRIGDGTEKVGRKDEES